MSRYVEKAGLDCLEIILRKCFCKNDDWLRNLTTVFEFCEVITTDKSKEVDELLKSGRPKEVAVELIIHSLQERKVDERCIANACKHAEFPGELIVTKAVCYFGTAAFVSDSLRWLVTAWNELCAHEVQVKTVIAENWETTARLEEHSSNWPLQFIMNCTSHKESENMIAKIKELLEQIALGEFEHIQKSELQGAEIPKEKDILRPLIERIFQQFFISQEDKIAEVLQLFTHFHLLSTENLSNALREAEKGKFSATNLMHLIVINSPNDWSEKMSTACQSKEFPGDKAFASIILALLTSDIIRDEIQWLIAVRDGLEQSQMLIDRIIPKSWKEQHDITLPGKFWPEHLIEICITSENLPEINNFLEKVKEILEKEPSAAEDSSVLDIGVLEDNESSFSFQSVDVTQEKDFLYESFDVISELFDEMKPFVESIWPDNEDLIAKKTWPSTVLMKCDTEDSEKVHSFAMKFREVVEKNEEDKDKLQTEKLYEESMQWLQQFSKLLKPNVNVIKPLAQTCWPNDAGVTRILPMTLINKCNQESDKVKVTNFIDQLKQVLETLKSEKTVDESIKEKSSIPQQTDENIDSKNQKPIVASSYKATAHDATIKELITKPFQEKTQETEEEKRGFEKSDLHVIVIEQILAQYFLSEKVSVMELLTIFHRSNLLTKENLLIAQKNTEQGRFSAPQLMNLILSNCPKDWKEKMVVACQNKDFEGDVFASILQNLLKRDVIDSDIIWFISVWNEVQKCNSVLEGIIADSWKDEHGILTAYESWPLYLYKKCILEEEEMKVKKFLHHMKEVLQNRLIEGPETLDDSINIRESEALSSFEEEVHDEESAMASPPDKIKDIPEHSQTLQQRKDLEDKLEESKNWIAERRLEPSELEHEKHISKGVKGSVHGERKLHPKSNNSEGTSVDEHQEPPKKKEDGLDQSTDFKDHGSALQWLHNQEHKDLKEYDDYTKKIVANFWPQKDEIVKDEHWPQALIKACQNSADEDTVNLINKIKDYFELIKVSSAEKVSENYQNLKEDEYVVEFRMICQNARKCSLIGFSHENWKRCNMKFDVRKKFYYFQMIVKKNYYLKYKYFMELEGWECLENNSNRVLHVTPDLCSSKKKVTLFDVVSFGKMDFGQVVEYLPSRSTLCHQGVDLTSITDDIYAWVFQMNRGWKIVSSHSERIVSVDLDSQTVINNWLKQEFLQVCLSENISCIICTLALCNAVCHSKYSFGKPLLKTLLKVLCTEKLSEEMLQKLYNEIFQHFINNDFRSAAYPNIPDTITSLLYEACDSGVAEFILILPLYQLIVNDGKVVRKIPRTDDTDWHLAVSCLPPIRNVQWKNVRSRLQDSEILGLLPQIIKLSGLHPWIVKSYQYMLSHQKIMQLTKDKSPICIHFNLEVILESTFQRFIRSASNIEELFDNMLHSDVNELEELNIKHILELIYKLLKQSNDDMQAPTANAAVIHCLNICSKALSSLMETTDSDLNSCLEILDDILKCIYRSVSESDRSIGQIKHWDALLQIKWSDKKISDEWIKELCECIKKRVYELWLKDDEDYWNYYDSLSGFEFHTSLENIFEARAEKGLDNLLHRNKSKWKLLFRPIDQLGKFIGIGNKKNKVFNKLVHKQLSSYNDKAELALKWPHLVKVLELFKNQSQVFTSENEGTLKGVITALDKIFADLISGDIVVERFNLIYEYKSRIAESLQYSEVHSGVNVEEVICFRKLQLDAVYKAKKNLEIFKDRCSELGKENVIVDVKELDDIISTKIKEKKMSQLVKCSEDLQDKVITVMLYGKDFKKMDEIEKIGMLHGNIFFKHYWSVTATTWEGGKGTDETATSWEKVLNQLWNSVSAKLISFTKRFDNGSMCISELPQKLTEFSDKEIETHFQELYAFYDKCHLESALHKKERISDVKKLRKLKRSQAVIDALASIKYVLALQGKFSSLEMFRKKDIAKMTLLQFSQLDYSSVVPNFSQHDLGVLVSFSEQKDLIDWLKKNIKGEKEVQPFYELAMSKIGDTPMEVDKVSSMYSAVIGYSPLLFELDKVIDVKSLIVRCEQILENCKKDENLCEKWNSIGACVDWIKEIRMLLGSDHVQAMSLAQKINENGIYVITCKNEKNISIEECLELQMQESGEKKTYKLADLRDLQSKLMLIAGEKEARKHVVTYVDLLAAVESLDQVFVDLVSAGCMLFQNWRMEIASSIESEFKFTMIFEEGSHPITGKGNLATIETILSTMKKSLDRWTKQMNKYRTNHYYLNEYNIQQITYLCRQLAKNQLISVPDQVTMLLARVKKNTTLAEITEALNEATSCSDDSDDEAENNSENNEENQKVRKMTQILRSILKKHSCSLEVAKAAVFATNYQDLDSCTDWIVINRNNKRLIDKNSEKFDQEIEFTHQSVSDFTIATVLHDRAAQSLKEVMNKLQQQEASKDNQALSSSLLTVYEKYISSTADKTLQDFLSVKHLGKFLSNLSKMRMKVPIAKEALLKREMKQPLRKGKPNLIICPENVILHQVLSLYMNSRDQPLPSTSEVLICSEKTNQDDIERFFRRAMCDCVERRAALFCLAFAHKLSYNVSQAAEKIFTSLSQSEISSDLNRDYQLVIFTTKQHHYLTTCFDQYHTDVKLIEENEKVTNYLAPHLKVDIRELTKTAACIEENFHFVKVVYSHRSGVGKTLHVRRLKEGLQSKMASHNNTSWHTTTIRFMEKTLDTDHVIDMLNPTDKDVLNADTHLIHLDFTPAVQDGVEQFAFNLLILGSIEDSQGRIWQRHQNHMYAVEITEFQGTELKNIWSNHIFEYLPKVCCLSPREVVDKLSLSASIGMDKPELLSDVIQRPIQYLDRLRQNKPLDNFKYKKENENQKIIDQEKCVTILLKYCTMKNPSWAQLLHFSSFLNAQLENCEKSIFCVVPELRGLKSFAVNFMIQMAQDFATPSLSSADQSTQDIATPSLSSADQSTQDIFGKRAERVYDEHQLRRTWEESSHPYIFFNDDCHSMTFINVNLTSEGHLVDKNKKVISEKIISPKLMNSLKAQGVPLGVDFDSLNRGQKLMEICKVMGIEIYPEEKLDTGNLGMIYITVKVEVAVPGQSRDKFYKMKVPDPDPTYELTTDNVLKILAIYLRFKCQIPVIIMGETGCGKTRMVEFISKLKAQNPAVKTGEGKVKNMITLKVHGGITVKDVHQSIERAKEIAQDNVQKYGLNTILFFDEANTTESIYAIKEAVCDLEVNGKSFRDSELQIVAACNPYKKLSKEAIKKLENSGLGYRVKKEDTKDKLGSIPMRTLVYRVVALPPSMQPLVWDFGQLADDTEKIYIGQMIKKLGIKPELTSGNRELLSDMLSDVQCYMREQKDETRYVSLRDVERCMIVYQWFWKNKEWLYPEIKKLHKNKISDEIRTLIQVLGVCYHTSLDSREEFRKELTHRLNIRSSGIHRYEQLEIEKEIVACQKALVKDMKIEKDIALNEALVENVFMIAICADMKIPLFLVGKPGSSKSLAKTIVSDNMQGPNSTSEMFKHLKQVQVVSFQCSALTRATGIERVFNQCVQLQTKQDAKTCSVVLVLDEIGLAEDSSNMPLKVLHPLLERGSTKSESLINTDPNQKVGFVGISNWSLDPAKMNRGLFVTRKRPTEEDLQITTEGIFSGESEEALSQHRQVIKALTLTYLTIYKKQEREYFGLRDFYSLMKMVRLLCMKDLTFQDIMTAVVRNFSGGKTSYTEEFKTALKDTKKFEDTEDGVNSVQDIIEKNLIGRTESRYLLLLTNQYSAVNLLYILGKGQKENIQIIFGSSFPGDKNYTEICRNINRIKICMEAGSPVVILNLAEINESLYEMLNQHYVTFGGEKYVELGLGDNRVKCKVHEKFRMIIIEKKEVVYEEYPIPLLNRLEKHHFDSHSLLIHRQRNSAHDLQEWVTNFTSFKSQKPEFDGNAAFPGYNDDTVSSVILMCDAKGNKDDKEVYQNTLLQSASMDSIFRLQKSNIISTEVTRMQQCYFQTQSHDSLIQLMKKAIKLQQKSIPIYEVTTYSNILSENDRTEVEKQLCLNKNSVMLLSLQQFETEQQFLRKLDDFFKKCQKVPDDSAVLLIQCFQAHLCRKLISCARYCLTNKFTEFLERNKKREQRVVIAFLLSTDRQIGSVGNEALVLQHTKDGEIVFIDELRPTMKLIGPASCFFNLSLQEVFEKSLTYLSPNGKPEEFLDIVSLLKESVSEAVNMLQFENREENLTGLISMLMELFEDKDFSRAIVQKISALLLTKEAQDVKWIIEEAFSHEHLLEGGTFRKTIWFFLKQQVTLYLAYITSIVYANGNLEHIKKHSAQWIRKMWLKLFHEYRIPFIKMRNEKEMRKEKDSFKVSCSLIHSSYRFKVPFISMIFKELSNNWTATHTQKGFQEKEKLISIFLKTVRNSPMYSVMKEAYSAGGDQMKDAFISDVVRLVYQYDPKPEHEVKAVDQIVNSFVKSKYDSTKDQECFKDGDEFAIVFHTIKLLENYLETLSDIFKICPELVNQTGKWINKSNEQHSADFEIHEYAFSDLMALISERSGKISDEKICQDWIELAKKVKRILRDHFKSAENKAEDVVNWRQISFLYYFLTSILPSMSDEVIQTNYTKVIAEQVNLLSKGCKKRNLQSKEYVLLVCGTLGLCYDEIKMKLLFSWQDSFCKVCLNKLENAVVLPCKHFLCVNCADKTCKSEGSICPTCAERIPIDYKPIRPVHSKESLAQLQELKSNCTSFFLRYLCKFIFQQRGFSDSDKEVPDLLIKELLVTADGNQDLDLSAIDLNVNFRSCVLKELINGGGKACELDSYINEGAFDLIVVALRHFESQLLDNETIDVHSGKWDNDVMKQKFDTLCRKKKLCLDLIKTAAEIRLGIQTMSCFVHAVLNNSDERNFRITDEIKSVIDFLNSDETDTLKLFFIKCGCVQFGTEWFTRILESKYSEKLVPRYLKGERNNTIDYWMLLGTEFAAEKAKLCAVLPGMNREQRMKVFSCLETITFDENLIEAFGALSWISSIQNPNPEIKFLRSLATSKISLQNYFASVYDVLSSQRVIKSQQKSILLQLLSMVAVAVSLKKHLVKEFFRVLVYPKSLMSMFLPAMPESLYYSIPEKYRAVKKNVLNEHWSDLYTCPNGHFYTIGDCTHPVTLGKCKCGEVIGGKNYKPAPGNKRFEFDEKTQVGYMLEDVNPLRQNMDKPEDRMSKQGVAVTQAILHSCMILALQQDKRLVSSFSKLPDMDSDKFMNFVINKLMKNLQDLSSALSKNMDETLIIMHKILLHIIRVQLPADLQKQCDWSSAESRKAWEQQFRKLYLLPVFKNLDQEIIDGWNLLNEGKKLGNEKLYRLTHDLNLEKPAISKVWCNDTLWKMILHPTSAQLLQTIQDKHTVQSVIIQTILDTPQLGLICHLKNVLELQKYLTEKYQYKLDMDKADDLTFENCSKDINEEDEKKKVDGLIHNYLITLKQVFPALRAKRQRDPDFNICFNRNCSISLALPSKKGRGQFAKMLVEHLIDIQNTFLSKCEEKLGLKLDEVSVADLNETHLVCIDKHKDLLPLIKFHTSYHITSDENGSHHHISYNTSALEKGLREKYVLYKKHIKKSSIPCIQYPQDVGIGADWEKLRKTIIQEPLNQKQVMNIDMVVGNSRPAELYEGVRSLAHAISFLTKVSSDPEKILVKYLEEDMMLSPDRFSVVSKNVKIKHILALYLRLSWHKAKQFTSQGLNPYKEYLQEGQEKIPTELKDKLKDAFGETRVSLLQQRLNEILIKKPDYKPNWSLLEHIFPYLDDYIDLNTEDNSWYKSLPKSLCFKHIADLFKLSEKFLRENQ